MKKNIQLRDYQQNLKNKTKEAFKKYKKVIMLAPCGAGKTVISSSILEDSLKKDKKVWFIVHRQELLKQAKDTFDDDRIKVYMIQTLVNDIKKGKIKEIPDMIICDERSTFYK